MEDGQIFLKIRLDASFNKVQRMSLIAAGSISLDSTFNEGLSINTTFSRVHFARQHFLGTISYSLTEKKGTEGGIRVRSCFMVFPREFHYTSFKVASVKRIKQLQLKIECFEPLSAGRIELL
jgi:hypothetical protein